MFHAVALINQNCRLAARLISEGLDRPLSRLERTGLAIHLTGCRSCRRYRHQLRTIDQLAGETAAPSNPPRTLDEAARARIALAVAAAIRSRA